MKGKRGRLPLRHVHVLRKDVAAKNTRSRFLLGCLLCEFLKVRSVVLISKQRRETPVCVVLMVMGFVFTKEGRKRHLRRP